jgi:2-succinyl-5-enolpyruvyl-6-hydroxy-3-cyclohexene-1-carboxylate synthase
MNTPRPHPRNRNELWSRALLDELARAGVRHLVIAPGSRSTPLVLAAAGDARFVTAVQIDERSAGFLALGVGKGTGVPAAVITTSGTAVANLLPAVVEAAQAEVPLLIITADRPPRLRGSDANQAIDQVHLFGRYVRLFQELSPATVSDAHLRHLRASASRAVAASIGAPGGPVHLNVAFEKPLEPVEVPGDLPEGLETEAPIAVSGRGDGAPFTRISRRRLFPDEAALEGLRSRLARAVRPVIIAGPDPLALERGGDIEALARRWGIPLLADPLSGARCSLSGHSYDLALREPTFRQAMRPDLVVRFGTTPSSMALAGWLEAHAGLAQAGLAQAPVAHIVVDEGERWKDHLALATDVLPGDPGAVARGLGDPPAGGAEHARREWLARWTRVDTALAHVVQASLRDGRNAEGVVAVEAARATQQADNGILFISNSMPIREVDTLWPLGGAVGEAGAVDGAGSSPSLSQTRAPLRAQLRAPLRAIGNRGASGIDGIVSTALGVAWGTGAPVTVLIGDLALFHDLNGFLALGTFDPGSVRFLVVNNDGGGIFHLLPIRDYDPAFTRFVVTPHGREPAQAAALHGIPFRRLDGVASPETLRDDLRATSVAPDAGGVVMLEIRTDREKNRDAHLALVAQACAAVRTLVTSELGA